MVPLSSRLLPLPQSSAQVITRTLEDKLRNESKILKDHAEKNRYFLSVFSLKRFLSFYPEVAYAYVGVGDLFALSCQTEEFTTGARD